MPGWRAGRLPCGCMPGCALALPLVGVELWPPRPRGHPSSSHLPAAPHPPICLPACLPALLQARSPVFRALLTGPMREGHESDSGIDIQDVRAPVFKALLYFAYTDSLPDDLQVGAGEWGG